MTVFFSGGSDFFYRSISPAPPKDSNSFLERRIHSHGFSKWRDSRRSAHRKGIVKGMGFFFQLANRDGAGIQSFGKFNNYVLVPE